MGSGNWIVDNLNSALGTWNGKLAEIWTLLSTGPEEFKGGGVWTVIVGINDALKAIGYALLVIFFVMGVVKTCGSFTELRKPEQVLKCFVRFALAQAAVSHGMELMTALFTVGQGMVNTIMGASGLSALANTTLPDEMVTIIEDVSFLDSIARMYNKLRLHDGVILKPALGQLDALNEARQRNNPAMLAVNKAIAEASDQSYKVSALQSKGVLDASAGAAKLRELDGRLAELRKERRRLLKEDDLEEALDTFRQTVNKIHSGPDRLEDFDETLFSDLVEKVTAESRSRIRFHLRGGIELAERV